MTNRILDISQEGTTLRVRNDQLVIQRNSEKDDKTVPLEDIAILVVSHAQTTYTHSVLTGLTQKGGSLIVCDEKHLPSGMCLPLGGHSLQAERAILQMEAATPVKKQLWKQIVCAKIKEQSVLLRCFRQRDYGLERLRKEVRSGDPDNIEARAAKIYWRHIFNIPFHRNRFGDPPNNMLNYGYAILRAIIARGICGAGLYPALGLHHHNRYNGFCLADDLMEPFRTIVDRAVVETIHTTDTTPLDLTPAIKATLIQPLLQRFRFNGEFRTLFDIASISANSIVEAFQRTRKDLLLPDLIESNSSV